MGIKGVAPAVVSGFALDGAVFIAPGGGDFSRVMSGVAGRTGLVYAVSPNKPR